MRSNRSARAVVALAGVTVGGLLTACGAPGTTGGDSYPKQNIDVIIPYPAGGGSDVIARAVVDEINANGDLAHDLLIVNVPGGGGIVGIAEVVEAKPDGYTVTISPAGPIAMFPAMIETPYDPLADLEPIYGLTNGGAQIAVPMDSPYQTVDDLLAAAKAAPGTITMGLAGPGYEVPMAKLESVENVSFAHVLYESDGATTTAILGGNLDVTLTQVPSSLPQVAAGTMRVLATFSAQRSPSMPDVPTLQELGIDITAEAFYGVYAPAGVPDDVIETLADAVDKAVDSPELQKKATAVGVDLAQKSAAELKKMVEVQLDLVADLKSSGAI